MRRLPSDPPDSASFAIPIYGGRVLVCTTREAFSTALERLNEQPEPGLPETAGFTREVWHGKRPITKIWLVGWFDKDNGTLVHEMCHTTFQVLRHAGVGISQTNDEAYAYLMDTLFTKVCKAVRRLEKRGNLAYSTNAAGADAGSAGLG